MAHYLVVAHGIAEGDLAGSLPRFVAEDTRAACTLLVTATHPLRAIKGQTPELEALARARAGSARVSLEAAGVYLARTLVGDGSAAVAVEDELRSRPDTYDAVVLCTPRPGVRSWLGGDVRTSIEERAGLPVFHVHTGTSEPWRRRRQPRMPRLAALWARTRLTPTALESASSPVPTRRQMVPLYCLMAAYLTAGLALAILVNRGFVLNDVVALCVYTFIIGGLLLVLRSES